MKDLKIDEWACWTISQGNEFLGLPQSLKTKTLLSVTEAFVKNAGQCLSLGMFPTSLFFAGRQVQLSLTAACLQLLGKPYSDSGDASRALEIEALAERFRKGTIPAPFPIRPAGEFDQAYRYAYTNDRPVFETLMSLQVVAGWTAFETLAGDLWEAAVNAHPRTLSDLGGGKESPKGKGEDEGGQIPIKRLQEYNYNVRDAMGTLLRGANKVQFVRLEDIRDAYARAFSKHFNRIGGAIEDASLDALAVARNLIVHKAGVCDGDYERRTRGGSLPPLPQLAIGQRLVLDGTLVKALVAPVLTCGVRLIQAVDGWLVGHPERERKAE